MLIGFAQSSNHVIGNLKNVLPNILLTYLTRADLGINRVVVLVLRFFICKVIYTKVEWVGACYSCLHAFIKVTSCRAGWIFHPSMSLGSSKKACSKNNARPIDLPWYKWLFSICLSFNLSVSQLIHINFFQYICPFISIRCYLLLRWFMHQF